VNEFFSINPVITCNTDFFVVLTGHKTRFIDPFHITGSTIGWKGMKLRCTSDSWKIRPDCLLLSFWCCLKVGMGSLFNHNGFQILGAHDSTHPGPSGSVVFFSHNCSKGYLFFSSLPDGQNFNFLIHMNVFQFILNWKGIKTPYGWCIFQWCTLRINIQINRYFTFSWYNNRWYVTWPEIGSCKSAYIWAAQNPG